MDKFYKITDKKDIVNLVYDAHQKSDKCNLSELNCSVSFARQKTDKSLFDIVKMMDVADFNHFVFIIRDDFIWRNEKYIEVGIRLHKNSDVVDYFIMIFLDIKHLQYFVEKYKLIKY